MATFKGFNTIDQTKKFGMTDLELIRRDLLNLFLVREGQMPGRPDVGTKIWNFIFEPLDTTTTRGIDEEVRRMISMDPRLELNQLDITGRANTVIVEISLNILPDIGTERLFLVFEEDTQSLSIVS